MGWLPVELSIYRALAHRLNDAGFISERHVVEDSFGLRLSVDR